MPITKPAVDAADYLEEDSEDLQPKVGTTIQQGWDAADALLKVESTEYPNDFGFTGQPQLIKFLNAQPFAIYEQHWIERPKGKKSFVCLGEECPLCDILGDKPRGRFAFNVIEFTGDNQKVQVLTAPPSLARLVRKAHEDERKGPLDREFWEISRMGTGPTTQYTLNFVRGRDLAEEWKLSLDNVTEQIAAAVPFTADEVVRETPRSELLEIARSIA